MKKLLQFLFGKGPQIFDRNGRVYHQHPDNKWKDWDTRYQSGSEYNWRNHSGTLAGANRSESGSKPNS